MVLLLTGSVGVQLSAAVASTLFTSLGTLAVSGLRMAIAGQILFALFRPRIAGRTRRGWLAIVLYGAAMAFSNLLFYNAVQQIPLGMAVTMEFLGPLAVAAVAATRRWELILPGVTLVGVVLLCRPGGSMNLPGLLFGLGAGVAFGAYTLLAGRVGDTGGLDGLALSVCAGAVLLCPFSLAALPHVSTTAWPALVVSSVLGVGLAFSFDFLAAGLVSARVVGPLFSVDPVVAAVTGLLVLHETIPLVSVVGIGLIVVSGAIVIAISGRGARSRARDDSPRGRECRDAGPP